MAKKSFRDIGDQAAKAFITLPTQTAEPEQQQDAPPNAAQEPRRVGRPRANKRILTKSSQENLPENWTRATFIVREDLLADFKQSAGEDGVTLKEAVNLALSQYLQGRELS